MEDMRPPFLLKLAIALGSQFVIKGYMPRVFNTLTLQVVVVFLSAKRHLACNVFQSTPQRMW